MEKPEFEVISQTPGTFEEVLERGIVNGPGLHSELVELRGRRRLAVAQSQTRIDPIRAFGIFDIAYPLPNSYQEPDLTNRLTDQQMQAIFARPAEAIHDVISRNGVSLPPVEDLLKRVRVVDEASFAQTLFEQTYADPYQGNLPGFTLPNRLVLISESRAGLLARQNREGIDDTLLLSGLYLLFGHSTVYKEDWILPDDNPDLEPLRSVKRHGLIESPPEPSGKTQILELLHCAFAEYLVRERLHALGLNDSVRPIFYEDEIPVIREFNRKLGVGPMIRALYTEDGLELLSQALDNPQQNSRGNFNIILDLMAHGSPYTAARYFIQQLHS